MEGFSGHDLSCWRGDRLLFQRLRFHLEPGAMLVVRGPNGSGKTSLLRLMSGLARPSTGEVLWNGRSIQDEPDVFRAEMIHIGHHEAIKATLTVRENLEFLASLRSREAVTVETIQDALETVELLSLIDMPAGLLSAGQARRLALALVFAIPAALWLLDEPTAMLDTGAGAALTARITGHCDGGGIAVLSSNIHMDLPGAQELMVNQAEPGIGKL